MKLSAITLSAALATGSGAAMSDTTNDTPIEDDRRICGQPFAGEVIKVSCQNVAGIIESQGGINNVQVMSTKDGMNGEQFNQVNKNGVPILYIYTPPTK